MDIEANVRDVKDRIAVAAQRAGRRAEDVEIVAVVKGVEARHIRAAVAAGIRHLGENRVQDAIAKRRCLNETQPALTWHMVGHLQTNKVKTALGIFDIIHSIDSVRLAEAVSRCAEEPVPILLQVNVSGEETKSGFSPGESLTTAETIARLPGLRLKGLMTIAPLVTEPEQTRPVFRQLRELGDSLGLEHLSMGMTDDFEVAVEEGATMVRIGRAIFEER